MKINNETVYTSKQVSEITGFSLTSINRWMRAGKIGYIKLKNNRVLFPESEVNKFLGIDTRKEK